MFSFLKVWIILLIHKLQTQVLERTLSRGGAIVLQRSGIIMCQLESTKCIFLFCLGISIIMCSVIYLRTKMPAEEKTLHPTSCRQFASECRPFLPERVEWCQSNHQVGRYILNSHLQCSEMIRDLHFITRPLSQDEETYPLAFIVTVHKDLELFVRMLRGIYMPQNVYCIHIDAKAPQEYKVAIRRLVECFHNVFLSSRSETVTYAGFSRLQADLNCMKDLVKSKINWRKVVNLCGQDFPVMSNLELVQYMQSKEWRDKNMTPGVKQPESMRYRTQSHYHENVVLNIAQRMLGQKKAPPPHNLQIYFGTAYYALTRAFVDFVLDSPKAQDLLEWSKDTFSPDEHYWVTLNHIKEAPGSHADGGWEGAIRAIKWGDQEGTKHDGCRGHYVRNICIFGLKDLPWIINRNDMFANKFESNSYPEALDCLEQWHRNKVLKQATVPIEASWLLAKQVTSRNILSYNSTAGA